MPIGRRERSEIKVAGYDFDRALEARAVRNADKENPGVVRKAVEEKLQASGNERIRFQAVMLPR
jgi:hypothetical protein